MPFDYGVDNPPEPFLRRKRNLEPQPIDWPLLIIWVAVLASCLLIWIALITYLEAIYVDSLHPSKSTYQR